VSPDTLERVSRSCSVNASFLDEGAGPLEDVAKVRQCREDAEGSRGEIKGDRKAKLRVATVLGQLGTESCVRGTRGISLRQNIAQTGAWGEQVSLSLSVCLDGQRSHRDQVSAAPLQLLQVLCIQICLTAGEEEKEAALRV